MKALLWLDIEVLNKTFIGLNHSSDNDWRRQNTNLLRHATIAGPHACCGSNFRNLHVGCLDYKPVIEE